MNNFSKDVFLFLWLFVLKNMDRIRLYTAQIPGGVEKIVRTLVRGNEDDVKDILPIELEKIERTSTECIALAEAIEKKFTHVMDLTNELLQVSSAAKGYYQGKQDEAEKKRAIALQREQAARERENTIKNQQVKIEKEIREAKEGYENALKSMPGGLKLIGLRLLESISSGFAGNPYFQAAAAVPSTPETEKIQAENLGCPDELRNLVTQLAVILNIASKGDHKEGKGYAGETSVKSELQDVRLWMESLRNVWISKSGSTMHRKALQLLNEGIKICNEAETLTDELSLQPHELEAIAKKASNLQSNVYSFCTKAQIRSGGNPFYTSPPRQANAIASATNLTSASVTMAAVENARFKIAEARGLLERQENRYDQAWEELRENNEKLSKTLQELADFSPGKIANFKEIRKTLKLGLESIASLRGNWQTLVDFFQTITGNIRACQKESLSLFIKYAKVGQKRVLDKRYAGTDFMRDLIYEQVNRANECSFFIWSMSSKYVEISRNHLMGRLASLNHLIALDPETDRPEIKKKSEELMQKSEEAQLAIKQLIFDERDEFHTKVQRRIRQIESELMKMLPLEDPARIKEIQNTVNEAIKEDDIEFGEDKF